MGPRTALAIEPRGQVGVRLVNRVVWRCTSCGTDYEEPVEECVACGPSIRPFDQATRRFLSPKEAQALLDAERLCAGSPTAGPHHPIVRPPTVPARRVTRPPATRLPTTVVPVTHAARHARMSLVIALGITASIVLLGLVAVLHQWPTQRGSPPGGAFRPTPAPLASAQAFPITVVTPVLNLRAEPTSGAVIMEKIHWGDPVSVIEHDGRWVKVAIRASSPNRREGWVDGRYLKAETLPDAKPTRASTSVAEVLRVRESRKMATPTPAAEVQESTPTADNARVAKVVPTPTTRLEGPLEADLAVAGPVTETRQLAPPATGASALAATSEAWAGILQEQGGRAIPVRLSRANSGSGTADFRIEYPSIGCSGSLVALRTAQGGTVLEERIERGPCLSGRLVTLGLSSPRHLSIRVTSPLSQEQESGDLTLLEPHGPTPQATPTPSGLGRPRRW